MLQTITYRDILNTRLVFTKFLKTELPFETSRKIQIFLDESSFILRAYRSGEKEILDKYAKRDDNGNIIFNEENNLKSVTILEDKVKEFHEEINKLLDTDCRWHLDEDTYFVDSDFENLKCTPEEVKMIDWIILS